MYDWYTILTDFGKIFLAAVIGGAIGFERESHGLPRVAVLHTSIACMARR
jgi:uncharacterized membrane protein YhiD involved in acid resistance